MWTRHWKWNQQLLYVIVVRQKICVPPINLFTQKQNNSFNITHLLRSSAKLF